MSSNSGFPPIAKPDARILILGSMPGQKSLQKNQYYAHPRNSFWQIICKILNAADGLNYEQRRQLLINNKIALWDVVKSCYRKGSLDSDIEPESILANNFKSFFIKHKQVNAVFFNGTKAEQLFKRYVLKTLRQAHGDIKYIRLPSTSPAHAAMTAQDKLKKWRIIKNSL